MDEGADRGGMSSLRLLKIGALAAWTAALNPASARAQDPKFWSFLEAGRVVTRCAESSAAHEQAQTQLARLDERIQALADADPPQPANAVLDDILKTPCFQLAVE